MTYQYNFFNKKATYQIDFDVYLDRIQCKRERNLTLRYLRTLHRNHLYNIPFENLDIHYGKQIILDVNKIYEKLIKRKRGGFCYELNGLFFQLLIHLGFYVKLLSARIIAKNGTLGNEYDHLFLVVYNKDKKWLVDVGFGELFLEPLYFEVGKVQMDGNRYFRIEKTPDGFYKLQSSDDSISFKDEFIFTMKERQFIEFINMCQYHQSSPKSKFTRNKIITKAIKEGRITLTDKNFVIKNLGQKSEEAIFNKDQFEVKLLQHFGIKMSD